VGIESLDGSQMQTSRGSSSIARLWWPITTGKAGFGTFKGEIDDTNPVWDISDNESDGSPDDDAGDRSGIYGQGKATKGVQKPVDGSRKCPPVITYESVVALLKGLIEELW
jgi:hypothetical protein